MALRDVVELLAGRSFGTGQRPNATQLRQSEAFKLPNNRHRENYMTRDGVRGEEMGDFLRGWTSNTCAWGSIRSSI